MRQRKCSCFHQCLCHWYKICIITWCVKRCQMLDFKSWKCQQNLGSYSNLWYCGLPYSNTGLLTWWQIPYSIHPHPRLQKTQNLWFFARVDIFLLPNSMTFMMQGKRNTTVNDAWLHMYRTSIFCAQVCINCI